jgi:predicted transcriptional regulator
MQGLKRYLVGFALLAVVANGQNKTIDVLIEKMNQAHSVEEKQRVMEEIKYELAAMNKQARQEAEALVNARSKQPSRPFTPLQP